MWQQQMSLNTWYNFHILTFKNTCTAHATVSLLCVILENKLKMCDTCFWALLCVECVTCSVSSLKALVEIEGERLDFLHSDTQWQEPCLSPRKPLVSWQHSYHLQPSLYSTLMMGFQQLSERGALASRVATNTSAAWNENTRSRRKTSSKLLFPSVPAAADLWVGILSCVIFLNAERERADTLLHHQMSEPQVVYPHK